MRQGCAAKARENAVITLERFKLLETILVKRGYGDMIEWSESIEPATDADDFAKRTIYVICNSGMANVVAAKIYSRCIAALDAGEPAASVFKHPGKGPAIDRIWDEREALFASYAAAEDKVANLEALPWIGEVTALHLAKNLGADTAKPDVHLERLARRERTSSHELCARLAEEAGYRVATIDSILWRACADRVLNSKDYERYGWEAAFQPDPSITP